MVYGVLYGIHLLEELGLCSDDVEVIYGGDNIFYSSSSWSAFSFGSEDSDHDIVIPLAWTTGTVI